MSRRTPIRKLIRSLAFGALTVSVACQRGQEAATDETSAAVGAKTITIKPQAFTETLDALGTVAGRPGHVAMVSVAAAGRVTQVLVGAGQVVQAGQPLVVLDQAPFVAARQAAEAAFLAAERAYERQQRLANEGVVPRKDAETAAADLARTRADATTARRAEQLSVVRSPITGVVTRVTAALGAGVDPAQSLVEIADIRALDVLLSVTPTEASRVRPTARVALSAGPSSAGEPLGVGTVIDVSATVDSTTRSVLVRVRAPTTRRRLRIGETVFGAITVATRAGAIVVPAEALVPEGDQFRVFVVDSNGIAHAREVKVGGRSDAGVEITEGLQAGERVVTYGAYGLQDSAKVVPLAPADSAKPETPVKPAKP